MEDAVDNEFGTGTYSKYMRRDMIKNIYLMIFPFRLWKDDYLNACYDIRREIKNWCNREDMRIPLLMIGRLIGLTYDQNMSIPEICIQIQDKIMNTCLTKDMTDQSGSLVISYKTNQPPRVDTYALCKQFIDHAKYDNDIILALYNIIPVEIPYELDEIARTAGEYNIHHNNGGMVHVTIFEDTIYYDKYEKFLEILRENYSNLTYENAKYAIESYPYETFPTYHNIMFLLYLHELFMDKKLSPLTRLDTLCSNPDVLKFSEWLQAKNLQ